MSAIEIQQIDKDTLRFAFKDGALNVTVRCGDITREHCHAIVNPTNASMQPDGGLDNFIHQSMGKFFTDQVGAIQADRKENACPIGQSRIFIAKQNPNQNEPRFVINTTGPTYDEKDKENVIFLLKSCFYTSLVLANLYQISSIAFPAISCGLRLFPPKLAAQVAIESVQEFSQNVKDVRFVLYERAIYDVFVQEWKNFAENANKQMEPAVSASVTESSKCASGSSSSSSDRCLLCKKHALPISAALRCIPCSGLNRSTFFWNISGELREAARKSFQSLKIECEKLKALLSLYPMFYNPITHFAPASHARDWTAEHYAQVHCDKETREMMPIAIAGDGNCFYNVFVTLSGTTHDPDTSLTPYEFRARNAIELVLNYQTYQQKYHQLAQICDSFEKYATTEMVYETSYASIWDFFSIPTVLNIDVISVYPNVNGPEDVNFQLLNNFRFTPLTSDIHGGAVSKGAVPLTERKEIRILFSSMEKPLKTKEWMPNHFVPLLRRK